MATSETVTRFAPSPTGLLHLGHAYAAWFARSHGDRMLLRIEDIDSTRCRQEFEDALYRDLEWCGIAWDGPVVRQSERMELYRDALTRLDAMGVLYPCFCSRRQILEEAARSAGAPQGPEGPVYPGTCRRMTAAERSERSAKGEEHSVRIDAAKAAALAGPLSWTDRVRGRQTVDPIRFGDFVVARKETPTSYHLSVVVDDGEQGVSLVTRGEDLFWATDAQRLLQALLGLKAPEYHHHGLVGDDEGRRLAKRSAAVSLESLRAQGWTAADVRRAAESRLSAHSTTLSGF